MPLSAVDAVGPAIEHAKVQLTKPFRFGQWVRLAFVGLLAGELGSFGGGGSNLASPTSQSGGGNSQFANVDWPGQFARHAGLYITLIVLCVLIGLGLVILFTYIGSVMRFVLFDSIIARECHVRQGWRRRKREGFRLFLWQICLMLISLATVLIVLGVPAICAWKLGWFSDARGHVVALVLAGASVLFLFLLALIAFAVIHVMTKDFVVPQMALEEIGAVEGWRRLLPMMQSEKAGYAAYIGMKILLAIGAAILFGIITLIGMFLLLLPIGGVAVVAVLIGAAAGLTWTVSTITLAVIFGVIALAALIFVALLISVPQVVFFPAYSIYFFAPRFPPLAAILSPQQPAT